MLLHLQHAPDQDVAEVRVQGHDGIHGRGVHREPLGDLACVQRATEQRLQPAA